MSNSETIKYHVRLGRMVLEQIEAQIEKLRRNFYKPNLIIVGEILLPAIDAYHSNLSGTPQNAQMSVLINLWGIQVVIDSINSTRIEVIGFRENPEETRNHETNHSRNQIGKRD